ncbi:MAG: hypothetical protein HRU05_09645 [Oceanospirillaceae bacterium]|nr:hypothetical protein [Oceanospirillaceae bacterium]
MSHQCELCSKTGAGQTETTYYGFEVFICHNCKDTDRYLDQIEGMTKCLCNNWFDQGSLREHLHNGPCCEPKWIGYDPAKPGTDKNVTFIHNQEPNHAF